MTYQTKLLSSLELESFDRYVSHHERGTFLQTSAWARVKSANGWRSQVLAIYRGQEMVGGAQIFSYPLPLGRSLSYIPYGPLWNDSEPGVLVELLKVLKKVASGIVLIIEPNYPDGQVATEFVGAGFSAGGHDLQPRETIVLDLHQTEEEILAGMRQTTRRYIRQAERHGLHVEEAPEPDLGEFYRVLEDISKRQDFGIHPLSYYQKIWQEFPKEARLFQVKEGKKVLGSYFILKQGDKSWELYGGVYPEAQDLRAGYQLKWQAIRAMKEAGVRFYDQWGVAPVGDERHDLAGVTYFKEGFGGTRVKLLGSYEFIFDPAGYKIVNLASGVRSKLRGLGLGG